jgi:hypothetical protein
VNVHSTSWISSKYVDRHKLARATSSLSSSEEAKHSNWLERIPHLARAKLIQSESEVRSTLDLEEERFMEDLVNARTALSSPKSSVDSILLRMRDWR